MRYDPAVHHRHSLRLRGYDYSQAGVYFVTICTQNREYLFGEMVGAGPCACPDAPSTMRLNAAGMMAQETWHEMPGYYPGVELDAFVVMPNHVHGIVILAGQKMTVQEQGQAQGPALLIPGRTQGFAPTECWARYKGRAVTFRQSKPDMRQSRSHLPYVRPYMCQVRPDMRQSRSYMRHVRPDMSHIQPNMQ